MRIAYLCLEAQQSRSHISGYAVHLNAMIAAFRRAGHEVGVVVLGEWLRHAQGRRGESPSPASSVREVAKRTVPRILWETAKDIRVWRCDTKFHGRYRAFLQEFRPDAIYEQLAFMAGSGMRLAAELGIPRMAELHAPLVEERTRNGRRSLLSARARKLEMQNLRSAGCIRAVSTPLKRYLVERGITEERILVQPNGTDVAGCPPPPLVLPPVLRSEPLRGAASAPFVFGFVGSFFRWHGIDVLIRAFAQARRDRPDIFLLIVGDGEDGAELRRLAAELSVADRVRFAGSVAHSEVRRHYAAMDACCMAATNWYGSPMKLLEYGAMRKPIIAPDAEPVRDFMSPDEDCLMVRQRDVSALAKAMTRLAGDPALRDRIAGTFHRKVLAQYTWDRVAGNLLSRLQTLVAAGGRVET